MNNCFSIYHTSWITSGPKSNVINDNIPTKAILFLFGCSEVNSTWLITSELANQREGKVLFTCVVYTKYLYITPLYTLCSPTFHIGLIVMTHLMKAVGPRVAEGVLNNKQTTSLSIFTRKIIWQRFPTMCTGKYRIYYRKFLYAQCTQFNSIKIQSR